MSNAPAIHLEHVSKYYGEHLGVRDLSATVPAGQLVGLLGPNGSGKTTTIRILSCFMPPTTGVARVCGFDVFTESLQVRRRLGYLPENCPLYPEMRVIEYLRWSAALKGLSGSAMDRAVFDVLGPCGIDTVRDRVIGTLSKGFRQRVGLASVLLHSPQVIILDEPTVGLDPLQVREFRALVSSLKGWRTVLLSSHILTEVEMICDAVIILHQGRVVAAGTPADLRGQVGSSYVLRCRCHAMLPALLPRFIDRLPGTALESFEEDSEYAHIRLRSTDGDPREALFHLFSEAGIALVELFRERVTLEDVFVQFTQNPPRKA